MTEKQGKAAANSQDKVKSYSLYNSRDSHIMDKNNFDGVRMVLALIVVFAHLAALTQVSDFEYFEVIFDSNFAVKGFFAISGFLVTKSYLSSHNTLEYAEKRFRRIYPAYAAAIALCLFIGLIATTLNASDFLKSPQTLKYALANLTFLNFIQPTLPLVFETNPAQAINGALWTIKVEVMLYFCIPALIYFFKRLGSNTTTLAVFFLSVAWVYFFTFQYIGSKGEEIARQFPGQLSYFALGAFFAVNEKMLRNIRMIALVSLTVLFITNNPLAKLVIDPIAYSSIVICLSTSASKSLNLEKYGDISYGIYFYHFPIIQLLIFEGAFEASVWIGFSATFVITLITALASWHFIEKKLLKRTSHYVVATES
ncbi:MAG: acyltransferase [Methylococcaceae bacterium]